LNRREFTAIVAASAMPAAAQQPRFIKSICSPVFPSSMPLAECFRRAREAGFEAIEIRLGGELTPSTPPEEARRIGETAGKSGLAVAAIWPSAFLAKTPLNSPDADVRSRGVEVIRNTIELATHLDCGAILLVPGRVSWNKEAQLGYEVTWERSAAELRKVLPVAERAKVALCVENVWNKFLLSPLEMRAYVDQFRSPWLQAFFDVGNVVQFGFPQDWILTLGDRIRRVHLKDYKQSGRTGEFVPLTEGDVDWPSVMQALVKAGYRGYLSPEVGHDPKDPDQLAKISCAVDRILAMV